MVRDQYLFLNKTIGAYSNKYFIFLDFLVCALRGIVSRTRPRTLLTGNMNLSYPQILGQLVIFLKFENQNHLKEIK